MKGFLWSDVDERIMKDGQGGVKLSLNSSAVKTSLNNILGTNRPERCFSGDTLVPTMDGKVTPIVDLVGREFYVYSYNHRTGCIEPARSIAFRTGVEDLLEVTLDNDKVIKCTMNHLFMLRDGSYKRAEELKNGDSLMPLYRFYSKKGYELVYQLKQHKSVMTHRIVMEWKLGSLSDGKVVHHKDFNKRNNNPQNLIEMTKIQHDNFHLKLVRQINSDPVLMEKMVEKRKLTMIKNGTTQKIVGSRPEFGKSISKGQNKRFSLWTEEQHKEHSKRMVEIQNRPEVYEVLQKVRSDNGKKFWHDPSMKEHREYNLNCMQEGQREWLKSEDGIKTMVGVGSKVGKNSNLFKARKYIKLLLEEGKDITEENFQAYRERFPMNIRQVMPRWESAKKWIDSGEIVINHKVKSIRTLGVKEDVYDLYVDKNHNFALDVGVFVHNCMRPTFGASLEDFLFENFSEDIGGRITDRIKEQVTLWDPRINLLQVIFNPDIEGHLDNINVIFTVVGDDSVQSLNIPVSRGD